MKINVMEEQRRKYQKYIENADSKELIKNMKWADRRTASLYMAYYNRIENARPEERAKLLKEHMSKEDEIRTNPSVTTEMTRLIFTYLNILWFKLSREDRVEQIWKHVIVLNCLNEKPAQVPKYTDNNEDLLWYEAFGDNFDYLCRVSCLLLENEKDLINKIGIEKDIVEKLYNCSTLDYSTIIPKMPKLRIEVTLSDMDNTITKIVMAMTETYKLYVVWTR